jgi:hypothetical protein
MKFFNAAANTGVGDILITPIITVTVPPDASPGNYSSTINVSVEATP